MEVQITKRLDVLSTYSPVLKRQDCSKLGETIRPLVTEGCLVMNQIKTAAVTSKTIFKQSHLVNGDKDALTEENKTSDSSQQLEPSKDTNAEVDKVSSTSYEIPEEHSEEPQTFRVQMDVNNFLPKEVDVKVHENYLVIHGKHGMLTDDHGVISREFTRKFEIPEDVDVETFRALVDSYGVLTVEASFKPMIVRDRKLHVITDPYGRTNLDLYTDLGEDFQKSVRHQIKDGEALFKITRELDKRFSSALVREKIV